jgi:hypothetical protein
MVSWLFMRRWLLVDEFVTSGRPGDVELAQRGGRDALYRENPLPAGLHLHLRTHRR